MIRCVPASEFLPSDPITNPSAVFEPRNDSRHGDAVIGREVKLSAAAGRVYLGGRHERSDKGSSGNSASSRGFTKGITGLAKLELLCSLICVMMRSRERAQDLAMSVGCPTCGSMPGRRCELSAGGLRHTPHRDRRELASDTACGAGRTVKAPSQAMLNTLPRASCPQAVPLFCGKFR